MAVNILFFIVSGLLCAIASIGFYLSSKGNDIDLVAVSLTFIASGIFAIAGVLA